jgi:hypothetical protein
MTFLRTALQNLANPPTALAPKQVAQMVDAMQDAICSGTPHAAQLAELIFTILCRWEIQGLIPSSEHEWASLAVLAGEMT